MAERQKVGRDPVPSAAVTDSQSIETTEEGAATSGYDARKKNVELRKRHLLIDILGLPLLVHVEPARRRTRPERFCCSPGRDRWCLVRNIRADGAYSGKKLAK